MVREAGVGGKLPSATHGAEVYSMRVFMTTHSRAGHPDPEGGNFGLRVSGLKVLVGPFQELG